MKNIKFICACSDLGVDVNGAQYGPNKIMQKMGDYDCSYIEKINWEKSNDPNDLRKNLKAVNIFNDELFIDVKNTINSGKFPITLGGDHSIAIGSALASRSINNIGIIWIDAHLDYNTFETTITGNMHGLPLAAINGLCGDLTHFANIYINPKNTVVVGYRSLETNRDIEMENIKNSGGTFFTDDDIKKYGMDYIMDKAFEIASNGTDGVHISYDLDSIDPTICPGVSVPEIGGLTYEEAMTAINKVKENINKVKSFDLVEYNPINDIDDKTLDIATQILNILIK